MPAPLPWLSEWDMPLRADRPLRVVGIDLGTTNSTITEIVWDPASPQQPLPTVIDVPQLSHKGNVITSDVVPSVVAIHNGKVLVGEGAGRLRGVSKPHLQRNKDIFWECKSEIGTRRTYVRAPEGFRHPRDISAHVLRFLHEAARDFVDAPIDRVVITVPASFGWEQRQDTLAAATAAGLDVLPGDMLDEPVAAFLDYIAVHGTGEMLGDRQSVVLVLDFGGGTCDVALLGLSPSESGALDMARLGVSRFHRIGGADIDDVIALDILLPELLRQHGRKPHQFSFTQKRDFMLPALKNVAASLKVKLSEEIRRRQRLGTYDPEDNSLAVSLPAPEEVPVRRRGQDVESLALARPTLTLAQFRRAVRPFVSTGLMTARVGEYVQVQSVFAPIGDVLERCGLQPEDVDAVLMVGGSSQLPPVVEAVDGYFPDAAIMRHAEPRDALRAIGRGAAYHALLMEAYGASPLAPTTGEAVSLRTRQGLHEIVPRNALLPYPGDGYGVVDGLSMPAGDGTGAQELVIEVVSGSDGFGESGRVLAVQPVTVAAPVRRGDPISLRVRVDENQRLDLIASVATSAGEQEFALHLDNPFSTVNPSAQRDRVLEIEESLGTLQGDALVAAMLEMAKLHAELGERERAKEIYERIADRLPRRKQPSALAELAEMCEKVGDFEGQRDAMLRAAEISGEVWPLFNLAYHLSERQQFDEALPVIEKVLERRSQPADLVLRGDIQEGLGETDKARADWRKALDRLGDPERADKFALSWTLGAARNLGESELEARIRTEYDKRAKQQAKASSMPAAATQFEHLYPERGDRTGA